MGNLIITSVEIVSDNSNLSGIVRSIDLGLKIEVVSSGDFSGYILADRTLDKDKICADILRGLLFKPEIK